LRGALPLAKLVPLAAVMRHSKRTITSDNAALLAMVMGLAPKEPTTVQVDDLLYAKGILEAHPLPEGYLKPVDVGSPTCQFAEVLRRTLAGRARDNRLAELEKARKSGSISARRFQLDSQLAILDHGRQTHTFANEFAKAVQTADMSYLLSILDRPDDANRATKQAVREVFGIKLIGVRAAPRRRAIFQLAGMDAAQQAEWEALSVSQREARRVAREVARAREAAEMSRIRMQDGAVVTGAEWVDRTIAEGFSEIVSVRQGTSVRYALADPVRHVQVSLRANDGTLAYARASLEQRAS
jgi:hypothetical protein